MALLRRTQADAGTTETDATTQIGSAATLDAIVVTSFSAVPWLRRCVVPGPARRCVHDRECSEMRGDSLNANRPQSSALIPIRRGDEGGLRDRETPCNTWCGFVSIRSGTGKSVDATRREVASGSTVVEGSRRLGAKATFGESRTFGPFRSAVPRNRSIRRTDERRVSARHGPITSIRWSARITYCPVTAISSCTI